MSRLWNSYPRSIRLLAVAAVIHSTGMACIWPLVTIYIHDFLGKPLTVAGVLLMLNQGAYLIGSLTGGVLFDRWGKMRTVYAATAGAVAVAVALGFTTSFHTYTVLLLLNGFFSGIMFPVLNALIGLLWPDGGRKGLNTVYVALNIGVAIGSASAGMLASISFAWTFFGNAALQLAVLLLFIFLSRTVDLERGQEKEGRLVAASAKHTEEGEGAQLPAAGLAEKAGGSKGAAAAMATDAAQAAGRPMAWLALGLLSAGLLVCWIIYSQWTTVLSAYMQSLGITLREYSLLWTLNGALILFGQPFISWVIRHFARTLKAQLLLGAYVFSLSMLILSQTTVYAGFFVAMFVITLGEMLVWPAVPTIAAELSPPGREGFIQGLIGGVGSGGRMVGPLMGAVIFEALGANGMVYFMAALALVAVACFTVYTSFVKRPEMKAALPAPEKLGS
ncbi:MFS transporter [Brevibacillus borstelensis]|jgi:MFS family permease|uniref:MFS transporter n=1 Tax=Brevibacillus borstelensis TaxID=45462 RepID=UPI001FA9814C|nr:MFS transporter [Brevibacillus borstelensis]MED1854523.1 MFS transporter [Brevibacillus borstelensis]